ncbi:MAG: hypothetical protein IKS52_11465 [Clostridia bacterium]|nr:hypothetical protein [Clostridia bacterium]
MKRYLFAILFALMALSVPSALMNSAVADENVASSKRPVIETVFFEEIQAVSETADEDPAEGYINKIMYPRKQGESLRAPHLSGASLTGAERYLYDEAMPGIAEIAAGGRDSSVFSFLYEDIFREVYPEKIDGDGVLVLRFTAEELGVQAILANGALSKEARAAAKNKLRVNTAALRDALLADAPYELYWFDKTAGIKFGYSYTFSSTNAAVTVSGSLRMSMAVAQEYSAGEYLVDTSYGEAAATAAQNARDIVAQYEDCSDYERLLAYKNAICELTSYNSAALNGNAPYGNPWQLVWVFDGDPDTNVVCEGYAKAFQYLNDCSESGVTAISPVGYLDGTAHMWNVVMMDDGKNYLVDVTNCDSGMSGYPDRLFLVGCSSGSVEEGYVFSTGSSEMLYQYKYASDAGEELKIVPWDYLDGGPAAPVCTFSATKGFPGYQLAVRLDKPADCVRVCATGETIPCEGRDVRIPLTEAGEYDYAFAVIVDGVMSDYGESVSVSVSEIDGAALSIPEGVSVIEEEAFRGFCASVVRIPGSVSQIGAYAFADNTALRLIDLADEETFDLMDETAFDGCPDAVYCIGDAEWGFDAELEFILNDF